MVTDEFHPKSLFWSLEGVEGVCDGIKVDRSSHKEPGYHGELR